MKKIKLRIKKETLLDILISIIVILLYVFVYIGIYNNFRERKRKETSKDIIKLVDKEIKDNDIKKTEEVINYNNMKYTIIGKVRIRKLNLYEPILKENNKGSYDTAVVKMYGPSLNSDGNVVLAAHNYMKERYFIKITELRNNDVIEITDLTGKTVKYYVYEYKTTSVDDVSYLKSADKDRKKTITLVTCTRNGVDRYYVKAYAK